MYQKPVKNLGFTLMELMVTVSIAAILMGIAVPSFTSTIASNRLTTNANALITVLSFARSEAIKRGKQVTVLRKGATSAQWESGWNVFVDNDGDENPDNDANGTLCGSTSDGCELLRSYDALPTGYTLRTGSSTYKDYAAFLPSGLSTVVAGDTFVLCSGSGTSMTQRSITINSTGRPRVSVTTGTCP